MFPLLRVSWTKKAVEPFMAFPLKAPYSFMCALCHPIAVPSSLLSFPCPVSPEILFVRGELWLHKGKTENVCPWQIDCFQCSGKNNGREEDWHKLAGWMIIVIMKLNRQSKSDSSFWHVVDSRGKTKEQSAEPAICYSVVPNNYPQLECWQNRESPAAASGRGRSCLIKP